MSNLNTLLPFGQFIRIKAPWHHNQKLWITNAKPSFFYGHNWQYGCRSDEKYYFGGNDKIGTQQQGELWFDEMDIEPVGDKAMSRHLRGFLPKGWPFSWPPITTQTIGRRPGIWGSNGPNPNLPLMLSWKPGAITSFDFHLSDNGVFDYKRQHPEVPIIIRFQHSHNWQEDLTQSAVDLANRVISKWSNIKKLDPYVYFCNEMNLDYESGDTGNQAYYETPEFYEKYARWIKVTADIIKDKIPEMKLVTPPFAFGHHEDGAPADDGRPKDGWAGYDYLHEIIEDYFDNILTFHAYWGDGRGYIADRLYHSEISSWYAFRWRRILKMFDIRYGLQAKMIIDEAGNFNAGHNTFFNQVRYFSNECLKDPRIIALTFFLWADPTNSPGNLPNSWTQKISDIGVFVNNLKALPEIEMTKPESPPMPEPEPPPMPELPRIKMIIEYNPGFPTIRGDWLESEKVITLTDPWGNTYQTKTGTKPGIGPGGFEFNTPGDGIYQLEINNHHFKIEMEGQNFALVTFEGSSATPEKLVEMKTKEPISKELAEEIMSLYPDVFLLDD